MRRIVVYLALSLEGCASQPIIRHPNGVFEDVETGRCFVYVAAGAWADVRPVRCPGKL